MLVRHLPHLGPLGRGYHCNHQYISTIHCFRGSYDFSRELSSCKLRDFSQSESGHIHLCVRFIAIMRQLEAARLRWLHYSFLLVSAAMYVYMSVTSTLTFCMVTCGRGFGTWQKASTLDPVDPFFYLCTEDTCQEH